MTIIQTIWDNCASICAKYIQKSLHASLISISSRVLLNDSSRTNKVQISYSSLDLSLTCFNVTETHLSDSVSYCINKVLDLTKFLVYTQQVHAEEDIDQKRTCRLSELPLRKRTRVYASNHGTSTAGFIQLIFQIFTTMFDFHCRKKSACYICKSTTLLSQKFRFNFI